MISSIPKIAISQRIVTNSTYHEVRDCLSQEWPSWVTATFPGAVMVPIPNAPMMIPCWWNELKPDALILSGGNNIGDRPLRDKTEAVALRIARGQGLPILGICRGLQLLAKELGETIETEIRCKTGENHIAQDHPVIVEAVPELGIQVPMSIEVNSFHEQGVIASDIKSQGLVFATSIGGVVEGIYHDRYKMLGLQWHPERTCPDEEFNKLILENFFKGTRLEVEK